MQTFRFILDIISLIAGIGVSVLAYYTFYLRFCSKRIVCLSYSTYSDFYGYSISINVENCSLRTLCIEGKVKIVYDNKYIMIVKKFEEPFILEPFRTYKIKGDNFTSFPVCFEELTPLCNKYLVLKTSNGKTLTIKKRGKIYKNKGKELIDVSVSKEKINGLTVAENVRYILCYNHKTVFITDTGCMSESVATVNAIVHEIPKEIVSSKSEVQNFFNDIFVPLKIPFYLKERKL